MVIDVRLRPLYGGFLRQVRNPTSADFSAQLGMVKPASVRELSVELMLREMDEAGVTLGIAPGRNGHFRYNVSNDEVVETVEPEAELVAKYEERYQQFKRIYPACKPLFR